MYTAIRGLANYWTLNRNVWAMRKAKELLLNTIKAAQEAASGTRIGVSYWFESEAPQTKLEKVGLVFDECGRSRDFVYGMIASARTFIGHFNHATEVVLVCCGAGLESIHNATNDGDSKSIGSDPSLTSLVIVVGGTDLEQLPENGLRDAIKAGTYSAVLATNARMLTLGVIPVLTSDIVSKRVRDEIKLKEHRTMVGSFRYAMDYCTREYIYSNGWGNLLPEMETGCIFRAFLFMARSALLIVVHYEESLKPRHRTAMRLLQELKQGQDYKRADSTEDDLVFNVGLATRDRYRESVGYKVGYLELKAAWPPAAEKHATLCESDIKVRIAAMIKEGADDITKITALLRERMERAVDATLVVRQGVSNTQGPDVLEFALKASTNVANTEGMNIEKETKCWKLEMTLVQAKNWTSTRFRSALNKAAKSIGVEVVNASANVNPCCGSAGYSNKASMALLENVGKRLEITDCTIARRIIVFSYSHSTRSHTDSDDLQDSVELSSREMLEPTISALQVMKDEDEDEAADDE